MAIAIVPTIQKQDHSKSRCFCQDFKWFLTKWWLFVRSSNGWASRVPIPFTIQTICNPTSFPPFEILTSQDFRSPLHNLFNVSTWVGTKIFYIESWVYHTSPGFEWSQLVQLKNGQTYHMTNTWMLVWYSNCNSHVAKTTLFLTDLNPMGHL